jgi:hypothetical protein
MKGEATHAFDDATIMAAASSRPRAARGVGAMTAIAWNG